MITQIIDMSLPDNEDDELEESAPSSIFGAKSPKEKQSDVLTAQPKCFRKGNVDLPPIITNRPEYHRAQQLAPKRG